MHGGGGSGLWGELAKVKETNESLVADNRTVREQAEQLKGELVEVHTTLEESEKRVSGDLSSLEQALAAERRRPLSWTCRSLPIVTSSPRSRRPTNPSSPTTGPCVKK